MDITKDVAWVLQPGFLFVNQYEIMSMGFLTRFLDFALLGISIVSKHHTMSAKASLAELCNFMSGGKHDKK